MEDNNHFWQLLARKLSGEASAGEKDALEQLLANDPALRHAAAVIGAAWQCPGSADAKEQQDRAASLLDRIKKEAS